MKTSDINPTAPPAEKRYTTHLFQPDERYALGDSALPLGSPLRISDTPEWPTPILFDAVYASAVLHHFGTQTLKDEVATTWKDIFYPGSVTTATHAGYQVILDKKSTAEQKVQQQAQEREARYQAPTVPDAFDMLMTLPYIRMPREELKAVFKEAEEKAEAMEQRRVREKVDSWMKQSNVV